MKADKKRVAIIGAGPSGLVSAKYALEYGLEPVVFEKSSQITGMWSVRNAATWVKQRSSTIRFLLSFSDHAWSKETRMYPFANEIHDYLQSYAKKHDLNKHIRLNHKVEFVRCLMDANKTWEVKYRNAKDKTTEVFDYLIVASGAFQLPHIPNGENKETFKGLVMHSSEFRPKDSRLTLKNVIVVGGSISAVQTVSDLVGHVGSVYHVFRRTPVVFPLLWKLKLDENDNKYSIMPHEFFYYTRAVCYERKGKMNRSILEKFASFQTSQNPNCPESLQIDLDQEKDVTLTLSDNYFESVSDSKIVPVRSIIKKYFENGILLDNGLYIPADAIIFCTGFKPAAAEYLDKPILEMIRYSEDNHWMPALLYKEVFAPGLETMAYVGLNRVPCFIGYEMQAKWANAVFASKIELPERAKMDEYVNMLEAKRNSNAISHQFPYGEYPELVDNYAAELGFKPDLELLKQQHPELHDYLWNDFVYWSHFMRDKEEFKHMLKEIREFKSQVYELYHKEEDIKQSHVIKEFSKNYLF